MKNVVIALIMFAAASVANAAMIKGEISMTGDWKPLGGTTVGTATGIDFGLWNGTSYIYGDGTGTGTLLATSSVGDFATVAAGSTGTIYDFTFAPFSAVAPLWSIGGFMFDLNTLSIGYQSSNTLVLTGSGTIYGNGYDATAGGWSLTANGGSSTFSWSSTVPEPTSLALMGLGLLGLGAMGRRRRN